MLTISQHYEGEERTINDMNVSCPYSFMFVVSLDSLELWFFIFYFFFLLILKKSRKQGKQKQTRFPSHSPSHLLWGPPISLFL